MRHYAPAEKQTAVITSSVKEKKKNSSNGNFYSICTVKFDCFSYGSGWRIAEWLDVAGLGTEPKLHALKYYKWSSTRTEFIVFEV